MNSEISSSLVSNGMSCLTDQFTCRRVIKGKKVQGKVLESNKTHQIGNKQMRRSKSQRNSQRANRANLQLLLIQRNSHTSNEKLTVPLDCKLTTGNPTNNEGDLNNAVLKENEHMTNMKINECPSCSQVASSFARNKHENIIIKVLTSSTKEHTCPTPIKSTPPQRHMHSNHANQKFSAKHSNTFMKSLARQVKKFTMSMNKSSLAKLLTGELYWVNNDSDQNRNQGVVSCDGKHYPVDSVEYFTQIKSFTPIELAVSRRSRDDNINSKRNKERCSTKPMEEIPLSSSNRVKSSEISTQHCNSSFIKKWTDKLTEIKTVSPIHFSVNKDRFSSMCNKRRPDHCMTTKQHSNQTPLPQENKANKNVGITDELREKINVDCGYVNPISRNVLPKEKYSNRRDVKKRVRNIHHLSNSEEHGGRESKMICYITSAREAIQKGGGDGHLSKYCAQCFLSVNESGEPKRNTENKTTDDTLGFQIELKSKRDAVKVPCSPTSKVPAYERVLLEFQSQLKRVETEKSDYQLKDLFRNLKSIEDTGESHISLAMPLSGIQSLREKGGYFYVDDFSTLPDSSCKSSANFKTVHNNLPKTQFKKIKENEGVFRKSLQNSRKQSETCEQKNLDNSKSRNPPYCSTTCNIVTFCNTKSRQHYRKQICKKNTERHGKYKQTRDEDIQNVFGRKYKRGTSKRFEQNKSRKMNRIKYCSVPQCLCAEKYHRLGARREYIALQDRLFIRKFREDHTSSECSSSFISDESGGSLCSIF